MAVYIEININNARRGSVTIEKDLQSGDDRVK